MTNKWKAVFTVNTTWCSGIDLISLQDKKIHSESKEERISFSSTGIVVMEALSKEC